MLAHLLWHCLLFLTTISGDICCALTLVAVVTLVASESHFCCSFCSYCFQYSALVMVALACDASLLGVSSSGSAWVMVALT